MQKIEDKIFNKTKFDYNLLIKYGFIKNNNVYSYNKDLNNEFLAKIEIVDDIINADVYDKEFNEIYFNIRLNNLTKFSNEILNLYINLLNDIKNKCTTKLYFITNQANRITEYIIDKYHTYPIFPWHGSNENHGVFKIESGKWFSIILEVSYDKYKHNDNTNLTNIINVKIDPDKLDEILKNDGFYLCYHMSKKNWVTISLDDTVDDYLIEKYIDSSFRILNS